jgi:uncharacterized membrane protein YdjX (TVP38/TMEM64 family)
MSEVPAEGSQDDQNKEPTTRVPRSTVFIASALLCVPAMIPFYYATTTEDATARALLIGLGASVLLINTIMVVLGVRWIERYGGE